MATTTQCIKVSSLRKETGDPLINLKVWMSDPHNVYVGRPGRVFIGSGANKEVFHYPGSKFANPYKLGEYTLEEAVELYDAHLKNTGLMGCLEELKGKNLGCFCDQKGQCHAKILARYVSLDK